MNLGPIGPADRVVTRIDLRNPDTLPPGQKVVCNQYGEPLRQHQIEALITGKDDREYAGLYFWEQRCSLTLHIPVWMGRVLRTLGLR